MDKLILGIDVGGTAIKIGLITEDGEFKHKWEIDTNTADKGSHIAKDIWNSVQEKTKELSISEDTLLGIGIGAPGFINVDKGLVYQAVNIGWENLNLADAFQEWTDLPVYVANDANVAALGENWKGTGDQAQNLMAITIGTGVGGGFIVNGSLVNGTNGTGGEIGHVTVDPNGHLCNCGLKGCLETVASATGIVRQAQTLIDEQQGSDLAKIAEENGVITAKDIFDLAKEGDYLSIGIVEHTTDVLGLALSNVSAILNPEKILIGGGVSKAGDYLIRHIDKAFRKYALPRISEACEITAANLGNDAGMIGAAYLVKDRM